MVLAGCCNAELVYLKVGSWFGFCQRDADLLAKWSRNIQSNSLVNGLVDYGVWKKRNCWEIKQTCDCNFFTRTSNPSTFSKVTAGTNHIFEKVNLRFCFQIQMFLLIFVGWKKYSFVSTRNVRVNLKLAMSGEGYTLTFDQVFTDFLVLWLILRGQLMSQI